MGILDEAIREHLELKRQHGADESELKGLEDEAFGPADRPDATGSSATSEAETQIISPGSSITAPAGEGDQLDKVFDATRRAEVTGEEDEQEAAPVEASVEPEATFAEHPIPEAPSPAEAEPEAETDVADTATVESPEAKPAEPVSEDPVEEGDAGDMLEAERHHLASHPTEHYDVDAAIAEEDEIDILSESSLSDELDRALDSGEVDAAGGESSKGDELEDESGFEEEIVDEGIADADATGEDDLEQDSDELLYQDAATEDQPVEDEPETGEGEADESADFFDQDDPLEATPDFLEETPEHDQLWFEQKKPKDFDFGD